MVDQRSEGWSTSVEDLKTSQSIGGHGFPKFDMLDAMIASALMKIITNPHFKKKVSLEEQDAKWKNDVSVEDDLRIFSGNWST